MIMSKKEEAIKELQEELFVEEHGVTKEQAAKLNEYLFYEPTGKNFSVWQGREIDSPSVARRLDTLHSDLEFYKKNLKELERKHEKLATLSLFGFVTAIALTIVLFLR